MIIIGLAGGKPCDRKEIGERLERFGRGLKALDTSAARGSQTATRLRDLAAALNTAGYNRSLAGLVCINVMTEAEAEEIRRRGGVIWHVMGTPSESVVIRQGDALVTHMQGGCRHFLDPMEAFSEVLLQAARAY
jgi:hypothetical protein